MGLRVTEYSGADAVKGFCRCAIECGPLLLAVVGTPNFQGKYIRINQDPTDPSSWLVPVPGRPCHFTVKNHPEYRYIPYYQVQEEPFTCYPVIG